MLTEENKKRRWWNNGNAQVFTENPPDETFVNGRLPFNNVGAKKGSDAQRNKFWINNGLDEVMIRPTDIIPNGYVVGRITSPKKNKPNISATGTKWWNNKIRSTMSKECPGPEWTPGRIKSK